MTRFRRCLVLLLVVLALPLQALAAAAMLHCRTAGDAAPVHQHEGHADHASHAAAAQHDADAAAWPDAAGGHACSACAACCTMAGLPAMAVQVAAPASGPEAVAEAPQRAVSFLTSGVERPPRPRA